PFVQRGDVRHPAIIRDPSVWDNRSIGQASLAKIASRVASRAPSAPPRAGAPRAAAAWDRVVVEYTPEMLAMLEAQRQHFASDDHIRREVEAWRDATPEERLAAVAEMCAAGDYFLSQLDPETLERVLRPVPLPDDTIEILMALRQGASG